MQSYSFGSEHKKGAFERAPKLRRPMKWLEKGVQKVLPNKSKIGLDRPQNWSKFSRKRPLKDHKLTQLTKIGKMNTLAEIIATAVTPHSTTLLSH